MPPSAAAKTSRPRKMRSAVQRTGLTTLLDAAVRHPVTLVCAGGGWGKTMAVSAWAEGRDGIAWSTADTHDNDPQLFWAYVLAALRTADVITSGNPLAEPGSIPADQRERGNWLATGFARLPLGTILVIDDVHEINDADVLRELSEMLRRLPPSLRLVLVSRAEPQLRLHQLRAAGEMTEIRTEHLAFTRQETIDLTAGHGLVLTADEVATLLGRTEGWATGLQLSAAYLAGHDRAQVTDIVGDLRTVDDYFAQEVLAGRTRQQRRFLLQTSICENLCAGLADAITYGGNAQRTLEQLERDNEFVVRLGTRAIWFRYHHLLRDMLLHRLRSEIPAMVPELHRRAASWHMANNSIMEALFHAVEARDWAYVGRLIVVEAGPLIVSARRPALVKILRGVPAAEFASTPELMICAALMMFHTGDYAAIPARLDGARARSQNRPDAEREPVEILSYTLRLAADRVVGDMPAVIDGTGRLLEILAGARSTAVPAIAQSRAIALNNRGLALLWTGRTGEAERDLWAGSNAARGAGVELTEINATGHLALMQAMYGSVHEAGKLASDALDQADRRGWRYALQTVAAHFALALVRLAGQDLDGAERASRDGARAHLSDPETAQRLIMLGVRARLAVARGSFDTARELYVEATRERGPRLNVPAIDRWLAQGMAHLNLAAGHPDQVEQGYAGSASGPPEQVLLAGAAYLRGNQQRAEEILTVTTVDERDTSTQVQARILAALVADARGQGIRATDQLADAVTIAAREGIRRPFAAMADARLDGLFRRLRLLTSAGEPLIADLIDDVRQIGAGSDDGPPPVALSERETEVLRYLSTMLTAAEIATSLGLSVSTIKAHTRAIYRKLGATRRTEAVLIARRNRIL
ncbi:LuxR C-terminal-related transcriptional regulator [Actinoplanes subglobosus]|uniref:LuxR C-terminal-related transcriptional regulator n=1 Tax=Actinoplanes subglobosus TaxID=1547892 RepID=A0ABV8J1E4_9ACTN